MEAGNAADAVRVALTGAVAATVGGRTGYYSFGPDTTGTAAADHKPFAVGVSGKEAVVRLEDLTQMPELGVDWDYDDRTWRVDVRAYHGSVQPGGGGGGGVSLMSGGSEVEVGEWTYDWVSPFDQSATVTTTVTFNKPGYEGLYFWNYHVHNHDFGVPPLGEAPNGGLVEAFVPVNELGVVANIRNSDQAPGYKVDPPSWQMTRGVGWPAPTPYGLNTEEYGDLWFTTPPRPPVLEVGEMIDTTTAMTGGGYCMAPGAPPTIDLTAETQHIPVNANRTSGSPWRKDAAGTVLTGLPVVRDFDLADAEPGRVERGGSAAGGTGDRRPGLEAGYGNRDERPAGRSDQGRSDLLGAH